MAKRGAGTELNHDNWDQEEESEEAGEFRKATDDQMKGRVIKKAKRRNLNEDQKKNVFAGFGGFTSSNMTAENAFSFLAKPADGADTKTGGFSFGSSVAKTEGLFGASENKTGSSGDGFSFGGASNGSGTENGKSTFSGFSFGSAAKKDEDPKDDGSMKEEVKNGDSLFSQSKPDAETPKPTNTSSDIAPKDDLKPVDAPVDDLFAKFTKKASGKWTCEVCMLSNDADKDKCVACEAPRPGAKVEAAPESKSTFSFGESGGFKFGSNSQPQTTSNSSTVDAPKDDLFAKFTSKASGKWTCDVCMLSNDADKDKCVACEAPRPGAKVVSAEPESKSTFSFGESGGFKFGTTSQPQTSSNISGFKFGSSDTPDTKPEANAGFKFGSTESPKPVEANGGFKFGSSEPSKPAEEANGFKFGSTEPAKPSEDVGGFKFGSGTKKESPTGFKFGTGSPLGDKSDVFKSTEGEFKFSSNEKVKSKINLEATDTPQTKSKKGEYLANLKALNTQVTNWIKSHVDENPLVDLTPVFNDYDKHINELKSKFNIQASMRSSNKVKLNLEKEVVMKDDTDEVQKDETEEVKKDEPKPFSFGLNQSGFGNLSSGFGTSTSSFQFGFLKKDENKADVSKSEDDEDAAPAEQVVETVVESDAIYTKKCKLFYKKAGAYEERGLGNIHLKKTEDSKLQVIVRADTALGNILLNIIMTEDIPLERVGKNNVMLICLPNPPIDPKADPEPVTFLIRVKTAEDADELKDKLAELAKAEN